MATGRAKPAAPRCSARHTTAMPPSPTCSMSRYLPAIIRPGTSFIPMRVREYTEDLRRAQTQAAWLSRYAATGMAGKDETLGRLQQLANDFALDVGRVRAALADETTPPEAQALLVGALNY